MENNYLFCIFFVIIMQAVQAMVHQAMQYIDKTPDLDSKIELIKTLNSVSAGKVNFALSFSTSALSLDLKFSTLSLSSYFTIQIYVEIERARLIKKLAKIKEEQGQIAEAADLMQEIAVGG